MTTKLLDLIQAEYELTAVDVGDMSTLKANGMKFSISAYYARGLGHISVMRASGFFGLMKMDTLIINPDCTDLPLYSYDRIFAAGNDTLIVELYDTMISPCDLSALDVVKGKYNSIADRDPGVHWYDSIKLSQSISKKGKKVDTPQMDSMTIEHFKAYLNASCGLVSDPMTKQKKADFYVNGLLEHGGPSTDVFKKALGVEKTTILFQKYLFGTKR